MKVKKICAPVLAVLLVYALVACSGEPAMYPASAASSDSASQTESAALPPTAGSAEAAPGAPAAQPAPEVVYTDYPLTEMGAFSEDRAWVKYGDPNSPSTALINDKGEVLFQTDFEILYCSPFEDGVSYVLLKGEPDYTWFIMDSEGTILSSNFDIMRLERDLVKTNNYILFGYADGHFLVAEHITGFDANEWRLGTIDKSGQVINELKPYTELAIPDMINDSDLRYIGDDIIYMPRAGCLYSLRENNAVTITGSDGFHFPRSFRRLHFLGQFRDGITIVYDDGLTGSTYTMLSDYLCGDMSDSNIFTPFTITGDKITDVNIESYSEGLIYATTFSNSIMSHGFYDLAGPVIEFPEYEKRQYGASSFSGGYAAMYIRGADLHYYVTVIDKTGARMYEPVKTDYNGNAYSGGFDNTIEDDISNSGMGYIITTINEERVVVCPDGKVLGPAFDDLSSIGRDVECGSISGRFYIRNGFYHADAGYLKLSDKTFIDSVSIEGAAPVTEEKVIPASTYTGSFSLAGMWQDDNGTILSFNKNGTVGPMLFGFEGGPDGSWTISSQADANGHYTLNASHLTGGNIIYKVRLLGEDEIEIYEESGDSFGSSFYHLVRQ